MPRTGLEQFDRTIAVNFRHVFFAAQAIVPQMLELGYGSIVNMSSVSWMRGIPLLEAYASAKAAIPRSAISGCLIVWRRARWQTIGMPCGPPESKNRIITQSW